MAWKDWDRRHGGYEHEGIRDVWLWSPDVPDVVVDLPLTSVVLDMEEESIGILVANYSSGYRHPTAEKDLRVPTHYAAAPFAEWTISSSGVLVPPPAMAEYIGDKSEAARLQQLRANREGATRPPQVSSQRPLKTILQREPARSLSEMGYSEEESERINDVVARIFGRGR